MDRVIQERQKGVPNGDVVDLLSRKGYKPSQISTAMNQSNLANQVSKDPLFMGGMPNQPNQEVIMPPSPEDNLEPPTPDEFASEELGPKKAGKTRDKQPEPLEPRGQPYQPPQDMQYLVSSQSQTTAMPQEVMHQIAEKVVYEKWDELMGNVGDIAIWKNTMDRDLKSVKQEILRLGARIDNLQNALLGKVRDYNESLTNVSAEIQALEGVLGKIIEPLTDNIKELDRITKKMSASKTKGQN